MFTNSLLSFTLISQIGNGGEAEVHLATDHQLDAQIAIKKIPKANFNDIDKFFEESKKLYLTTHHNIVKVLYGSQDNNFIYLALPHYQNGSLKGIIDDRFLTSREIIRYSLQFLSGLNNIHSKGLLHFDIKPENILIDESNKALISDFGLAEYMGNYGFAAVNGTTEVLAPPELFNQAEHNIKFDIYQAGITLYRMCNGDEVFMQQMDNAFISRGISNDTNFINNLQRERFPNRSFFLPHIPKPLRNVIRKSLKANPDDRYNSILEMLNDLAKINIVNDWFYTINGNIETWIKRDYIVTCTENTVNNIFTISALKKNRRKTQYCQNFENKNEASNLLYDCLNTNW